LTLHKEVHFEAEICEHLVQHGWLYEADAAQQFQTSTGLFLPDLLAWLKASQPDSLQRLEKTHGAQLPTAYARA
jgi:type I restriction enzyme R subunit